MVSLHGVSHSRRAYGAWEGTPPSYDFFSTFPTLKPMPPPEGPPSLKNEPEVPPPPHQKKKKN